MPRKSFFSDFLPYGRLKNKHSLKYNTAQKRHYSVLASMLVLTPLLGYAQSATPEASAELQNSEMLSQQNDMQSTLLTGDDLPAENYSTITNVALGKKSCLTLQADNRTVALEACQNSSRQYWQVSWLVGNYQKITNQALAGGEKKYCLSVNDSSSSAEPKMLECSGSGFTSQRSWTVAINSASSAQDIVYTLKNKYRGDLGKSNVLGYSGNRLQMVTSSASDDVSWRLSAPDNIKTLPILGEKKVLLLHTHYSNKAANPLEPIQRALFGNGTDYSSLASAIRIASYGQLTLTGNTLSDINLGPRPSSCSSSVVTQAKALASEKGTDPDKYDYTFVEIPATSCSWNGRAAKPGNWIIGNASGHKHWMWQHEFGHNLGANHGKVLQNCTTNSQGIVQLDSQCQTANGTDPSDSLAGGGSHLYPAPYLFYAGWLSKKQMPLVKDPGNYTLTPLFTAPKSDELKGLRILRRDGTYLTLEYRQPLKGFETWKSNDPFVNGVVVRMASFGPTVQNTLVDTTPGSADGMKDAPLMPGKSIDDTLSGKRITLISADGEGARVHIDNIPGGDDPYIVPTAVVPDDFSIIARTSTATIRLLDGSRSNGEEFVWKSLGGAKPFGLQVEAGSSPVDEVRTSVARAAFLGGNTGQAKYQLTVTGSNGMTDSKIVTVTVLPAQVDIYGETAFTTRDAVTFNSQDNFGAAKWHWSLKRGDTLVAESSDPVFIINDQNLIAGTYQVALDVKSEDSKYQASAKKSVTITYPPYVEGTNYAAGDKVTVNGVNYSCKPAPFTGWCSGAAWAYAPGTGSSWQDAWNVVE